jgi:hypothetical protein
MVAPALSPHKKNFWNLWDGFQGSADALGDIKLAGFILQHWFTRGPVSVASIGMPSRAEFLALNALVDASASFVVLGTEPSSPAYGVRLNELGDLARHEGYDSRFLITDMTLPGRWAELLPAIAIKHVGLVGINARWALFEPKFWDHLSAFIAASKRVVYIRGALDFEHPDISMGLLRSMPAESGIEVIAATPSSLWFGPVGEAAALREVLTSSCLFGRRSQEAGDSGAQTPIVVHNDWTADVVDHEGRFIRKLFNSASDVDDGLEFGVGWASPEADGRWSDGAEATATIPLPPGVTAARRLSITGNGWVPPNGSSQLIELGIGRTPKRWIELQFVDGAEIKSAVLEVMPSDIVNNRITLKIKIRNPGRPSDYGNPDSRVLGFKFRALALFT